MSTESIPISQINPAPYNPRIDLKPGDPEFEKLKRSIEEFGFVEPLVWNKQTGHLVGGHQRLKILKALGHTEVEVVVVDLPSIDEQRRACIALCAARDVVERTEDLIDASRLAQSSAFESMTASPSRQTVELGSLLAESPRNGCSAPPSSQETGHRVLALSAISRWGYRRGELKPVEPTDAMMQALISRGDLVVSRSNTRELVGLPAVFDEDRSDVSYPDTMMRLRFDPAVTDARFVEMALRSRQTRRQVQSFAAGTSSSMKKINSTNLRKVELPHPPLEVQQQIVEQLSTFRHQIQAAALRRERALKVLAQLVKAALSPDGAVV